MIVSIHQPQYMPWLPYLLKIYHSDLFIFLDSVDFQKNGVQNRNQIKTAQGKAWLTVPVYQHLGQKIKDVVINNSSDWRQKHWRTLKQNYGKANFYILYAPELENLYLQEWHYLIDINMHLLELLMKWLGIRVKLMRSSRMRSSGNSSELILNLCKEVNTSTYISGVGGKNYLDEAAFRKEGIKIEYLPPLLPKDYPQQYPKIGFINDLSSIDILMNCGNSWIDYVDGLNRNE